jgi:putative hydrolase of the HAD superfamily
MSVPMIWFDFGGVLSPTVEELYRSYEAKSGISRERLESAMHRVAQDLGVRHPLAALELAMISEPDWGRRVGSALRTLHPDLDLSRSRLETFGEQWFQDIRPNQGMVLTLHALRNRGCGVGILTNNVVEWEPHWTRVVAPVLPVDHIIDSCKLGVRKPDRKIFEIAAETAGVAPAGCVLIDDSAENCAAARAMGWRAVHFRSNLDAIRALRALLSTKEIS